MRGRRKVRGRGTQPKVWAKPRNLARRSTRGGPQVSRHAGRNQPGKPEKTKTTKARVNLKLRNAGHWRDETHRLSRMRPASAWQTRKVLKSSLSFAASVGNPCAVPRLWSVSRFPVRSPRHYPHPSHSLFHPARCSRTGRNSRRNQKAALTPARRALSFATSFARRGSRGATAR